MNLKKFSKPFFFIFFAVITVSALYVIVRFGAVYFESIGPREEVRSRAVAPNFNLPDSNGQSVSLAGLKGRPVILVFWTSWSDFAVSELETLEDFHTSRPVSDVAIIAINSGESSSTVSGFAERFSKDMVFLSDETGETVEAYDVGFLPLTVFVDRAGLEASRIVGPASRKEIQSGLDKL